MGWIHWMIVGIDFLEFFFALEDNGRAVAERFFQAKQMHLQSLGLCWQWALMVSSRHGTEAKLLSNSDWTASDQVPFTRWELDEYYDPNPDTLGPRNTTAC